MPGLGDRHIEHGDREAAAAAAAGVAAAAAAVSWSGSLVRELSR